LGLRVGDLGWRLRGWILKRLDISVPFLLTFLFVPLLPVPLLLVPLLPVPLLPVPFQLALFLPKVILGFNKQTLPTHVTDKAESWCHPAPPICVR